MNGIQVFNNAMQLLGYGDSAHFKQRALICINAVYSDLYCIAGKSREYTPIKNLGENINLPEYVLQTAMVYGVAEKTALAEGDGEIQQYFALLYDKAKQRLNITDKIYDEMP